MMKLKEIANAFGMTVSQFAAMIGYSRYGLYEGLSVTPRARAAVEKLHTLNTVMLKMDQEMAQQRFEDRENAINDFKKSFLKDVKNDGCD